MKKPEFHIGDRVYDGPPTHHRTEYVVLGPTPKGIRIAHVAGYMAVRQPEQLRLVARASYSKPAEDAEQKYHGHGKCVQTDTGCRPAPEAKP